MVIRTEYRGQRYSMGSSDPLLARVQKTTAGAVFETGKTGPVNW
jgi:hypothetical protein